jgi:hypothetical protein
MKKAFTILAILIAILYSCNKKNNESPNPNPDAGFTSSNKSTFYLTEPVKIHANYQNAGSGKYKWDWGDGTITNEGPNATHAYQTKGYFKITLAINNLSSSNKIRILPGQSSFQIINNSSFALLYVNFLRRINDKPDYDNIYETDTLKQIKTDTIYDLSSSTIYQGLTVTGFCGTNFSNSANFTLAETINLVPYHHQVLTITDKIPAYYINYNNEIILTTLDHYSGYKH